MNYSLDCLPNCGRYPIVFMDIMSKSECLGRIHIRLDREVFPAGVENFVRIAAGMTYRTERQLNYIREIKRTYDGCRIFHSLWDNYIVTGDIYCNDGTRSGTIFCDLPFEYPDCGLWYNHNAPGLISLVPYFDECTGQFFYDSTFMVTLNGCQPCNVIGELDIDQIVIGRIYQGLEILPKINCLIRSPAGSNRYSCLQIGKCGAYFIENPICMPPLLPNAPIIDNILTDDD